MNVIRARARPWHRWPLVIVTSVVAACTGLTATTTGSQELSPGIVFEDKALLDEYRALSEQLREVERKLFASARVVERVATEGVRPAEAAAANAHFEDVIAAKRDPSRVLVARIDIEIDPKSPNDPSDDELRAVLICDTEAGLGRGSGCVVNPPLPGRIGLGAGNFVELREVDGLAYAKFNSSSCYWITWGGRRILVSGDPNQCYKN